MYKKIGIFCAHDGHSSGMVPPMSFDAFVKGGEPVFSDESWDRYTTERNNPPLSDAEIAALQQGLSQEAIDTLDGLNA